MLFELNLEDRGFCAKFNGETPDEVVKILAGIGYVSVREPLPVTIQGVRTAEGQLAAGVGLDCVRTMVESALLAIPENQRSANNDSLQFTLI